jgi:hypothetical protein
MGVTAMTDLQALHLEWVSRRFHLEIEMNRGVKTHEDIRGLAIQARKAEANYLTAIAMRPAPKVKKNRSRTPAQLLAARHYAEAEACQVMWTAAEDIAQVEVQRGVMSGELLREVCENAQAWFEEYDEAIGRTATSTSRELAHKALLEGREDLWREDIQEINSHLESQWAEWTTEELEPPNEVLSSSLRCNGPPMGLVREVNHSHYSPTPVVQGQGRPSR